MTATIELWHRAAVVTAGTIAALVLASVTVSVLPFRQSERPAPLPQAIETGLVELPRPPEVRALQPADVPPPAIPPEPPPPPEPPKPLPPEPAPQPQALEPPPLPPEPEQPQPAPARMESPPPAADIPPVSAPPAPAEPARSAAPEEPARTAAPEEPARSAAPEEPVQTPPPTQPVQARASAEPIQPPAPSEPTRNPVPSEPARNPAPSEPARNPAPSGSARKEWLAGGTGTGGAIFHPAPVIPPELRRHALDMVAVVHFTIGIDGRVAVELEQATADPQINQILLDTFRRWRFFPAMQGGKPVVSTLVLRVPIKVE